MGGHLSFTVPGIIRGKQRAGRMLVAGGVRSFNPEPTAAQERLIRQYAAIQMRRRPPFEGPMRLAIRVYKVPPKSWSENRKRTTEYVTGKPDCDNVAKLVADALNKIVWHDDSQIAELIVSRRFGEAERTHIEIEVLSEKDDG